MLHILGMVLKGIGITLLCILLLLLFLLLAILFAPIRYRITADKPEEGSARARIKAGWLFSIVTVFAEWEGRLRCGVKIFGFSIYDNLKKKDVKKDKPQKRRKKKRRKREEKKKEPQEKARVEAQNKEAQAEEGKRKTQAADDSPVQSGSRTAEESSVESEAAASHEASQKENTRKSAPLQKPLQKLTDMVNGVKTLFRKLSAMLQRLCGILQKIAELPEKLNEKSEELREKWESYRAFLEREDFRRSVSLCRKQLFYVWRKVRPRRFKVRGRFGFDDPSVTGRILAYAGMLYPLLGKDMMIEPDFERKILVGSLLIKGRITVVTFVRAFCVLYFNRDVRRMISMWKTRDISE